MLNTNSVFAYPTKLHGVLLCRSKCLNVDASYGTILHSTEMPKSFMSNFWVQFIKGMSPAKYRAHYYRELNNQI